jgi:hypothetical protein
MPRTWSYRKRDYRITKPVVKGFSPQIMGLIVVYAIMGAAITIGMTYALTHKIAESDSAPPVSQSAGHNGQAPLG